MLAVRFQPLRGKLHFDEMGVLEKNTFVQIQM
jgi:hypothetical protein